MGGPGGQTYDFEPLWRRDLLVLGGSALFFGGAFAFGVISGGSPGRGFGLTFLVPLCVVVGAPALMLVRRAVVDGDRLTLTMLGRERTMAVEDVTHTSWLGMYRLLQYRGGIVLLSLPLGDELVRELRVPRRAARR